MQYQRRQIEDGRQRWAAEDAAYEQRQRIILRRLKRAAIALAVLVAIWLPVAWNLNATHPVALALFFSMFAPTSVAMYTALVPR